jgi:hypothetical protein
VGNKRFAKIRGVASILQTASPVKILIPVNIKKLKKEIKVMSEDNNTGNNLIWAITTLIIVAIIAGALYYSGFLGGTKKERIDINVTTPAAPSR